MDLKLNKSQYETLLRLVFLGNWVVNGFKDKDKEQATDDLENYLYAKARDFGLGDRIIYDEDADAHFLTSAQEEPLLEELDAYKNDVFWDELMYRLADRDLVARFGEDNVDSMSGPRWRPSGPTSITRNSIPTVWTTSSLSGSAERAQASLFLDFFSQAS
jgi:hypothetical protein